MFSVMTIEIRTLWLLGREQYRCGAIYECHKQHSGRSPLLHICRRQSEMERKDDSRGVLNGDFFAAVIFKTSFMRDGDIQSVDKLPGYWRTTFPWVLTVATRKVHLREEQLKAVRIEKSLKCKGLHFRLQSQRIESIASGSISLSGDTQRGIGNP